jgi:hypothetical protein
MVTDSPFGEGTFGKGLFDEEMTSILVVAFEAAWDTVCKSGSPLAAADRASSTRDLLAKRIIERAQAGERDPKKLIDDALAHLTLPR